MRRFFLFLFLCLFISLNISPAAAQTVDISGPWILEFPQGRGMVVLQNTGGQPPSYRGQVTISHSAYTSGNVTFTVKMLSVPSYVVPGNDITFQPETGGVGIGFFMMNVSSGANGIAWVIPNAGADNYIRQLGQSKAIAHR